MYKKIRLAIIIIFITLAVAFGVIIIKDFIAPDKEGSAYGDRLSGIENYKIENSTINETTAKLSENAKVISADVRISGKIVNIKIKVENDFGKEDARKLLTSVFTFYNDGQKSFYDFQFMAMKDDYSTTDFPVIGYKNSKSEAIFWSNN